MTYRSNLPEVVSRLRRARMAGLIAAATVLLNAVKRGVTGGYTSGAFYTGASRASVIRTEPDLDRGEILVGSDVPYMLYWEVGHYNIFTRRFERKEVWFPALRDHKLEIETAYGQAFARELAA